MMTSFYQGLVSGKQCTLPNFINAKKYQILKLFYPLLEYIKVCKGLQNLPCFDSHPYFFIKTECPAKILRNLVLMVR